MSKLFSESGWVYPFNKTTNVNRERVLNSWEKMINEYDKPEFKRSIHEGPFVYTNEFEWKQEDFMFNDLSKFDFSQIDFTDLVY